MDAFIKETIQLPKRRLWDLARPITINGWLFNNKLESIGRQVERKDIEEAEVENMKNPSNQISEQNYRVK